MRNFLLFLLLLVIPSMTQGQIKKYFDRGTGFGLCTNGSYSGTGIGPAIAADIFIEKHFNGIEFGTVFQTMPTIRAGGLNGRYKLYLNLIKQKRSDARTFFPYLHYSFLYRNFYYLSEEITYKPTLEKVLVESRTKVLTFENYFGAGLRVDFMERFRVDLSAGYGAYLSSHPFSNYRKNLGIHYNRNGYNAFFNIGAGYKIVME